MLSKVPVLGKIIQMANDLSEKIDETNVLLRNGGGDKLKRCIEARKLTAVK